MICNGLELPDELDLGDEVLIVGSGPVGLVIARRLAERGKSCVVLEAGGELAGEPDRDCLKVEFGARSMSGPRLGRTRQLGGGLNLWGGQLAWFHPGTLDLPASNWPICAQALDEPMHIAKRLLGAPQDAADPPPGVVAMCERMDRFGLEPVVTSWLSAPKWTRAVWSDLFAAKSIRIVLGAAASALRLDPDTGRVAAVVARTPGGARRIFRGKTIVIAAGTIESVRLLLQADEQGQPQPWHALPWLGRGFCEHLEAAVAPITIHSARALADFFDPSVRHGIKQTWKLFGQVHLGEDREACGVLMLSAPGNLRNSISELRLLLRTLGPRSAPRSIGKLMAATAGSVREVGPLAWRYLRHRRIGARFRGTPVLRASIEQAMRWDNRIELGPSRDRLGIRRAKLHWHTGEEEGRVFRTLAERGAAWLEARGMGHAAIDPLLLRDPGAFAHRADEGLHPAAGARMSLSAASGVVDANLQVHGVPGLFVCGACVFPRAGYANPTLPAAALGARLADYLAAQSARGAWSAA